MTTTYTGIIKSFSQFKSMNESVASNKPFLSEAEISEIVDSYLESALWTSEPDNKDEDDMDLRSKTIFDFSPEARIKAISDVKLFLSYCGKVAAREAIDKNGLGRFGHDIWLTRNRHGAGFFDGNYENVKQLEDASHKIGEVSLEVSDADDLVYFL